MPMSVRARLSVTWAATALVTILAPAAHAAPPANDMFASATEVTALPFQDDADLAEATTEVGEPQPECDFRGTDNTVWYALAVPSDVVVSIDARSELSDSETNLAVWTGTALGDMRQRACGTGLHSIVSFRADAATTYYVQVGSGSGPASEVHVGMRETRAGTIRGTVTDAETGVPLRDVYVLLQDEHIPAGQATFTRGGGVYEFIVREGSYLVYFGWWDGPRTYQPEWYENARDVPDATRIQVEVDALVEGVDAELEPACPRWWGSPRGASHIFGTSGDDTLTGTPGPDVICGFEGDDIIDGLGGNDLIFGDDGDDTIHGRGGSDLIFGDQGDDTIYGLDGDDILRGDDGNDVLIGGSGHDRIWGGINADRIRGNRGSDRLNGWSGMDLLWGGPESDELIGGTNRDVCRGGSDPDRFKGCEIQRGRP